MTCTRNGSATRSHARTLESAPETGATPSTTTAPSALAAPPCLCDTCRTRMLDWLRQYERELTSQAQSKRSRNGHLTFALSEHVAQHLRRLRRALAKGPGSVVAIAKELFEATEVNNPCD